MTVTANSIVSPQTPNANAVLSTGTGNTTYTTSPTQTSVLITAGANGGRVTRVQAIATVTQTLANQIQLFRSTDAGATKRFFANQLMAAGSIAANTANQAVDFGYSDSAPLILKASEIIYVATSQSQLVSASAEWGDY